MSKIQTAMNYPGGMEDAPSLLMYRKNGHTMSTDYNSRNEDEWAFPQILHPRMSVGSFVSAGRLWIYFP